MAQIEKQINENFNTDDILMRSIIAGLLNLLNNQLQYGQVWDDNINQTVSIPWYYDLGTSEERFMQDNYLFFGQNCFGSDMVPGTHIPIPNGILSYDGSRIESSNITNRFIQGTYMKGDGNGGITTYTSFLYSIPITATFKCTVTCDNIISALKTEQVIRESFYKNRTFHVLFRGMRIGACVGFPEDSPIEKTTDYSFDSAQKLPKITFSLTVETYQPCFDKTTEMERSKYIKHIGFDYFVKSESEDKKIVLKPFDTSAIYPCGSKICFEWYHLSENSEMMNVCLSYKYNDGTDDEEHIIEHCIENKGFYVWTIPNEISTFHQPIVTINDDVDVVEMPKFYIIPNEKTKVIDANSFVFESRGLILTDKEYVNFTLEYTDDDGEIHIADNYYFIIENGKVIDDCCKVHIEGKPMKYVGSVKKRNISVFVRYTNDLKKYDKIDNLLIL